MRFAHRTGWARDLNRLTKRLTALKAGGRAILDLTESNPTHCQFHYPPELIAAQNDPKNLTYEPSPKGLEKSREVVATYYAEKGASVQPEQLILTASTSEAYSFLFRLLLNPKEKLLVPRPSYPLFEYLVTLNDVAVSRYPLVYDTEWRIDKKALGESVTPDARALISVHPNNPTGSYVKTEEKKFLVRLAAERDLSLICDEVFLDYAYESNARRVATFAGHDEVLTFTLSGISKILGLPQMKLAWIVVSGPKALRKEALERLEVIADTYLSVNTPSQQALKKWFAFRPLLQEEIQKRLLSNRNFLLKQVGTTQGCEVLGGEGGWYAVLRLPDLKDEEEWVLEFLEKDSLLLHPGYFFDFAEGSQVVLSLLVPDESFQEGVRRLFSRVRKNI